MKLLIYGLGSLFQKHRDEIPMKEVEAFVDKSVLPNKLLCGIPVIQPNKIEDCKYDYIVVFSDKFYNSIREELETLYFVSSEKILSWRAIVPNNDMRFQDVKALILYYIRAFQPKHFLDIGGHKFFGVVSPSNGILRDEVSMDLLGKSKFPYEAMFYRNIIEDISCVNETYDFALMSDYQPGKIEILKHLKVKQLILIHRYSLLDTKEQMLLLEDTLNMRCKVLYLPDAVLYYLLEKKDSSLDCVNYVITHKAYPIQQDEMYKTLCVGKYAQVDAFSEQQGDSIFRYNDRINETTGIYWIWKNTNSAFVGLSHYRRYFYNNSFCNKMNRLDKSRIEQILCDDGYDIILSEFKTLDWSIYENIERTVGVDFNANAYRLFENAIKEKHPDYLEAFHYILQNNSMYICNMFVTRREVFEKYCEWLFSFLLDVTDQLDVSKGNSFQKRTAGYYSEVLLSVWVVMQHMKIFELPLTDVFAKK